MEADLENEQIPIVLIKLAKISKTEIEQINSSFKEVQILDKIWEFLLDKPEKMIKGLVPVVKALISEDYLNYHFEETEIENL